MGVTLKSASEIAKMRVAGRLAAQVLEMIQEHVQPGITTDEFIVNEQNAIPAPLDYRGFPKSICTSVNHQVCHGIPGGKRLKKGDIVNIDITVIKDGYHGDTSKMFFVGEPSVLARRLIKIAAEAMPAGNYSVVREYCGHGIGREFHEEPQVLHYGQPGEGLILREGMCFTVEPMVNAGKRFIKLLPDGWTVVTKDRSLSAQWEHTVLVTAGGHDILTLRQEERDERGLP